MSRRTYTLRVGARSVRTTVGKRWHVAVDSHTRADRLKVTRRTDDSRAVLAEVRRLRRLVGISSHRPVYVFEYGEPTATSTA